jgi:hypothetical protein
MNLEQFIKQIRMNFHKLPNVDATMSFLRYHLELLEWKKRKLKLGAVVFEVKETIYQGLVLTEEVDIRYIRQDTTESDKMKLENRLKAIGWKWDKKNIIALFVVLFILRCGFEASFELGQVGVFKKMSFINHYKTN